MGFLSKVKKSILDEEESKQLPANRIEHEMQSFSTQSTANTHQVYSSGMVENMS
jgi:hypothetical protein